MLSGRPGRLLDRAPDLNLFDLLTAQIANTLIVLSLTSVLSGSFGQAYWVDIKTEKLIRPFWGCFVGITVYLLTGTAFSVVSYAAGFREGVAVSALGATLLLVVLTFKMISVYFGKEELKRSLRITYRYLQLVNNTPYVSDYLRRAERFLQEIGNEDFPGNGGFCGTGGRNWSGYASSWTRRTKKPWTHATRHISTPISRPWSS